MKKQKYKKKLNFILPFCITLTFVTLAGLFVIFSYLWVVEDAAAKPGTGKKTLVKEDIPESVKLKRYEP